MDKILLYPCATYGHSYCLLFRMVQFEKLLTASFGVCVSSHCNSEGPRSKRDLKDIECFNCHCKGHYSSQCPRNALFVTERRTVQQGESKMVRRPCHSQNV